MTDIARSTQSPTINSGALLSSNIDLTGARRIAIAAPVTTSGQLYLQVGQTSGTYLGRLWDPRSQAAWRWDVAAGSACLVLDVQVFPFAHGAIEAQNSQANLRTFTIVVARE